MAAAFRIFGAVEDDVVTMNIQQSCVRRGIEARMVELVAEEIASYGLPFGQPAREHQHAAGGRVSAECREHSPLVVGWEMKEAVPGDHDVEFRTDLHPAHVRVQPSHLWKS